jgi:hypothetical protein
MRHAARLLALHHGITGARAQLAKEHRAAAARFTVAARFA